MNEKRINEFKGVILLAAGLVILASLLSFDSNDLPFYTSHPHIPPKNLISTFGAYLAGILMFLFGWASYCLPAFFLWLGTQFFRNQPPLVRAGRIIGLILLVLSSCALIGLMTMRAEVVSAFRAGFLGFIIAKSIAAYFGELGGYILFSTLIVLSLALVTEILISTILMHTVDKSQLLIDTLMPGHKTEKRAPAAKKPFALKLPFNLPKPAPTKNGQPKVNLQQPLAKEQLQSPEQPLPVPIKPKIKIKEEAQKEEKAPGPKAVTIKSGEYQLPALDLLDNPPPIEARQIKEDLTNNARILEDTLADFGIAVKVTDIERGPIITRYELEPAPGVKVNRIEALEDDIALSMKAQSVRIIAPIPGKARVGVEVPNLQSSLVYLKEVLSSDEFQKTKGKLALALGKDISGQAVIADLAQMPHLLIAGTTGSGKTVCVNTIILSLLFRYTPNELKMLMIDPKMVELAPFNGLPHLLSPVVTESKKASTALNWVVIEMERRYHLLAEAGTRNIQAYNEKQEKLPFIVVVIDEFADLMVVARDQVENAVTRLAQLSRAVGIHLILATQRPSVDVITGVIKANLPARISFKVASKVDSRTVLDGNGADKLLGRGDMLFSRPEDSKLVRAQGALVRDHEIEKVVASIKVQAEPVYDETIVKEQQKTGAASGEKDELYDEAVRVVMESNQASVSILQRRMRLGYTRAGRLIDMMHEEGLVGPYEGSKPRKILVDRQAWLTKLTNPEVSQATHE
ncbi:MAG TPA: DNA translocase FtsK [Candidatus Omnitrophota bacterium]|nr:DNA translocase FtsK [Candidatus Omnitrophota bacterium]HRZ14464.1 DNA translocase FtsK [Candidatus Omnitrophota bacterium]